MNNLDAGTGLSWWPLLVFGLVLALIPLSLWLMRRAGLGRSGMPGLLTPVASLALSPTQRVVIVALARPKPAPAQWLVLGVSADRISTLATLDAPVQAEAAGLAAADPVAQPAVQALIERWRQGRLGSGGEPGAGDAT